MAITPKIIVDTTVLGTSVPGTPYFTCPTNQKAQVRKCTLFNYTALAVTVTAYIVPSGQAVSNQWKRSMDQAVAPGQSIDLSGMRQLMQPGDFITAYASAVSSVTMKCDADIIT